MSCLTRENKDVWLSGRDRVPHVLAYVVMMCVLPLQVFAQKPADNSTDARSANRRISDSLFLAHNPPKQVAKAEDTVSKAITKRTEEEFLNCNGRDMPSATLYQHTWHTGRVKGPDFSFSRIPDEIVLRLIDESRGRKFCFPIKKRKSSSYGWRWGRPHTGIDLALNTGDKVFAAFDGVVRLAKYNGGYGNCVVIRHYNNLETLYGHLSKINVKVGQAVKAGDVIGLGGSTGHSTGPHLHFECRLLYACFDPEWIFDLETYSIKTSFIRIDKSYFGVESSEVKANKKAAKSRLSKVDECFEGRPYVKSSTLIAEERKLIKQGKLPQYSCAPAHGKANPNQYVIARKGDKMSEIAKRYNLSQESLQQMNPDIKTNKLTKDTKIRIK